jgi:hypothetical protein
VDAHIAKPVDREALFALLRRLRAPAAPPMPAPGRALIEELIPSALSTDLSRPLEIGEGADASCLGDEAVPGGAAGVDDGLLAGEQPARQIASRP